MMKGRGPRTGVPTSPIVTESGGRRSRRLTIHESRAIFEWPSGPSRQMGRHAAGCEETGLPVRCDPNPSRNRLALIGPNRLETWEALAG